MPVITQTRDQRVSAYRAKFEDMFSWDSVEQNCEEFGRCFLGTVFALMPSGKYYMPWCSNATVRDAIHDEDAREALESVIESHGYFLESGEGDPCDLFAVRPEED